MRLGYLDAQGTKQAHEPRSFQAHPAGIACSPDRARDGVSLSATRFQAARIAGHRAEASAKGDFHTWLLLAWTSMSFRAGAGTQIARGFLAGENILQQKPRCRRSSRHSQDGLERFGAMGMWIEGPRKTGKNH